MTNEIYSLAEFQSVTDCQAVASALATSSPLRIFSAPDLPLHGFPSELRPADDAFLFALGDSPHSMNAEYLLDNRDYDPKAAIGLPIKAKDRLALLFQFLSSIFTKYRCTRLAVCLTVCNEVDDVKHLQYSQITDVLREDCRKECPPCKIYVITP